MNYLNRLILLIFLQMIWLSSTSQSTSSSIIASDGARLDSLLTPYILQIRELTNNNAGLAIGVTKGDEIIYARTFGYEDIENSKVADPHTVFHIASVSKPFTAVAIVKLIDQGLVGIDDPIIKHIPDFEMADSRFKEITIKQVLNHTSGIPRHVSTQDWENPVVGDKALEKNLEDVKTFSLDFEPGNEFSYSNSAFDILGVLISRVSGMSFEEYVRTHILVPAGMSESYYSKPPGKLPEHWAKAYSYGAATQTWEPYPYTENYFPSSGLQTTLLDLCNWGILHANNGRYKENVVIRPEYFSLLSTPSYETPWGDMIGLSWFIKSYMDRPIIMHQGSDTGFESIMYVYPDDSISIVVMANRDFSRTGRMINAVSEFLFTGSAKEYTVSAMYPFSDAYNEKGIEYASALWSELKADSTDIYTVNDEDILTMGAVLENGKNWMETKEILEFYMTLDNESKYAWRLLGNAYLNLGDIEKARSSYEQCLLIDPEYEKAIAALDSLNRMKRDFKR